MDERLVNDYLIGQVLTPLFMMPHQIMLTLLKYSAHSGRHA